MGELKRKRCIPDCTIFFPYFMDKFIATFEHRLMKPNKQPLNISTLLKEEARLVNVYFERELIIKLHTELKHVIETKFDISALMTIDNLLELKLIEQLHYETNLYETFESVIEFLKERDA